MSKKVYYQNNQANESVSKYKLLSAYGGPGSIVHTQYGSVIISCIEEWGFLKKILEIHKEFTDKQTAEKEMHEKVSEDARLERNGNIGISNDHRLLESLQVRKELTNLNYLVLVPDIEVVSHSNKIKDNGVVIAIPSTYMPKVFADNSNNTNLIVTGIRIRLKELKIMINMVKNFIPQNIFLMKKRAGQVI